MREWRFGFSSSPETSPETRILRAPGGYRWRHKGEVQVPRAPTTRLTAWRAPGGQRPRAGRPLE